MLELIGEGILYRNPHPGHRAVCAFLPSLAALSAEEVLCFFRTGQAFYSLDGAIAVQRSKDGGRTWSDPVPVLADSAYSYTAPHASVLPDGSVMLVSNRYPAVEAELFRFNPETGGLRPYEVTWVRSQDGGHTWSPERVVAVPVERGVPTTPSGILALADSTWFLPVEVWKSWDDPSPLRIVTFGLCSRDEGATWDERIPFPELAGRMYSHGRYTPMSDGTIGATVWTQAESTLSDLELHLIRSDATGRRWNPPVPTGLTAQTSWLADAGNGRMAVIYTVRAGMVPGIYLTLLDDPQNALLLWDAVGQEFLGVDHKPSYPASHNNIAFGKPNLLRLPDGDLLCAWWCTQACVTHTRWARVRVVR